MARIGIITCAGCPTLVASGKILRSARAVAEFRLDALHFSYCMTTLCPFVGKYQPAIQEAYPNLEIVLGTHKPIDPARFQGVVKELLCPTVSRPQTMGDVITGNWQGPASSPG